MDTTLIVGISLIALTIAVIGLFCGLIYFLFIQSRRISDLEAGFQGMQREVARRLLQPLSRSDNLDPPDEARRNSLLRKLEANTIRRDEAIELNEILAAEERMARERGDTVALVAIGLGIALVAALLARRR